MTAGFLLIYQSAWSVAFLSFQLMARAVIRGQLGLVAWIIYLLVYL
jgi:hypothetical protein